jgi:hypothetical protein
MKSLNLNSYNRNWISLSAVADFAVAVKSVHCLTCKL